MNTPHIEIAEKSRKVLDKLSAKTLRDWNPALLDGVDHDDDGNTSVTLWVDARREMYFVGDASGSAMLCERLDDDDRYFMLNPEGSAEFLGLLSAIRTAERMKDKAGAEVIDLAIVTPITWVPEWTRRNDFLAELAMEHGVRLVEATTVCIN